MKRHFSQGQKVEIRYDNSAGINYAIVGYVTRWDKGSGEIEVSNLIAENEIIDVKKRQRKVPFKLGPGIRIRELETGELLTELKPGDKIELEYRRKFVPALYNRVMIPAHLKLVGYVLQVHSGHVHVSNTELTSKLDKCTAHRVSVVNEFRLEDITARELVERE